MIADKSPDEVADPNRTFSYTLNISQCLAARGMTFNPGEPRPVSFSAILPPSLSGQINGGVSGYVFQQDEPPSHSEIWTAISRNRTPAPPRYVAPGVVLDFQQDGGRGWPLWPLGLTLVGIDEPESRLGVRVALFARRVSSPLGRWVWHQPMGGNSLSLRQSGSPGAILSQRPPLLKRP